MQIRDITSATDRYNFHSHTPWCDGHAPMRDMIEGAEAAGMEHYGVSPHSPVDIASPCNMATESVMDYIGEMQSLKEEYRERMKIYTGMEIDFLREDWGPHTDYFRNLPLDYRIGSVHFVPNQEGTAIDCDGRAERFAKNLKEAYGNDLRYVVERYFHQVLSMIELGGFDILGHPDKIAANASSIDPSIESYAWYKELIEDVASKAASSGLLVEINTKAYTDKKRFFPADRWWETFARHGCTFVVNSDAHWSDRTDSGRKEALALLRGMGLNQTTE